MKPVLLISALALFIIACVPARKYEDVKTRDLMRADSLRAMRADMSSTNTTLKSLQKEVADLRMEVTALRQDTARLGQKYRQIEALNKRLEKLYEDALAQKGDLLETSDRERQKLAAELEKKEMLLNQKEKELNDKERLVADRERDITKLRTDLEKREQRVNELEGIINRQDSMVNALRKKVADALLNFSTDELTVEMRNGKVYVSLAAQLLFKTGSTAVDAKGKDALQKLASVLKNNPDIDVMIEGHTDTQPLNGSGNLKDNWDLSVLRATAIVRILTESGVKPQRIMATGRGEYQPVASNETAEGRARNRRTEIILSPKLDELYQLLEK